MGKCLLLRVCCRSVCSTVHCRLEWFSRIAPPQTQKQPLSECDSSAGVDGCESGLEQQEEHPSVADPSAVPLPSRLKTCSPTLHRNGQLINVRINAEEKTSRNIEVASSNRVNTSFYRRYGLFVSQATSTLGGNCKVFRCRKSGSNEYVLPAVPGCREVIVQPSGFHFLVIVGGRSRVVR